MSNDPAVIDEMLRTARKIAVVGMSTKPWRASHNVGRYLAEHGFRIFPVNPMHKEILGMPCYANLDMAQDAALKETDLAQAGRGFVGAEPDMGSDHDRASLIASAAYCSYASTGTGSIRTIARHFPLASMYRA